MKKIILTGAIALLFAVATVFNMGLLNFNKQSDATLEAIAVMAEAQSEVIIGTPCSRTCSNCWCSYLWADGSTDFIVGEFMK